MALAFPLALADFLDRLPVGEVAFTLSEAVQLDETGGGEQLASANGARLWGGRIGLGVLTYAEEAEATALVDAVRQPGRSFLVTDLRRTGPRTDPTGAALGAATPVVFATQAGGREVSITGMPPGYVVSAGDMLSFDYGSPARRALHRVVVGRATGAGGVLQWLEVIPEVRPATWPVPVTLLRPTARALFVPGSFTPGESRRGLVTGAAFGFIQTLAG